MQFSDLRLSPPLLRALEQEGYTIPTPIQAQAIPHALEGRDVLGCAQTGTGKTAAFALPILHRLFSSPVDKAQRGPRKARALILSPTRELASQIGESFGAYGRETGLKHTVIFGGVSQLHQERALARGVDIIVATPGRLIDLMQQRLVDLSGVEVFVLDEADRMLDMGFIDPIRRIAAATPSAGRQTLLFSATMPKPIMQLANSLLRDPVRVSVNPGASAAPLIEQSLFMVPTARKQALLHWLLEDTEFTRVVVFTRTKHGAERVGKKLLRAGVAAETIHGNKAQNARRRALESFRDGRSRVLVATDVAARGLDVDNISHVINFDLPVEAEAYVHRIGRTGRAGASGIALSFCEPEERGLLRDIERLLGTKIEIETTPEELGAVAREIASEDRREVVEHRRPAQPRTERQGASGPSREPRRPQPKQRAAEAARPPRRKATGEANVDHRSHPTPPSHARPKKNMGRSWNKRTSRPAR
jgi:ATP-dependent RNA helicase RhlE